MTAEDIVISTDSGKSLYDFLLIGTDLTNIDFLVVNTSTK